CGPDAIIDTSNYQRILEHMAAHILFDLVRLQPTTEPCGLCLCPAPQCQMVLRNIRGADRGQSIDHQRSSCPNLKQDQRSSYARAAESTEASPCSNVPLPCPLCNRIIWHYNLALHFQNSHNLRSPQEYPKNYGADIISEAEKSKMRLIWEKIKNPKKVKPKGRKSTKSTLSISEAHSLRLALRYLSFFVQFLSSLD
ncbi:hypothetical protein K435DRAFT_695989, partial [Dendrothele bispora CBS 962.96]